MNGPERSPASRRSRSHRPPSTQWPSDTRLAIGLVALAWLHRILFLFSNVDRSWGFSVFYEGDSETFYNYARAILAGTPYDGGIPFHPPLFPHLLSFVHLLIGAGDANAKVPYVALKVVMALIGSIPVGLLYLIVRSYFGRTIALVASLLTLYSFGQYILSIAPVSEGLYSTLLLLSLLVWTKVARRVSIGDSSKTTSALAAALGVLFGLLALTRAEGSLPAVLLIGILAGTHVVSRGRDSGGSRRASLALSGLILVTMLLTLTPWTVRNAHHLGLVNRNLAGALTEPLPEFVPITAYGPLNFALANHDGANGEFSREILTSQREAAILDVRDPQHLRYFLHGYAIGWEWIRQHPGEFAALVFKKWRLFFGSLELGWTQWNVPGGLNGVRRPVDVFVPSSPLALFLTVPLLLLGTFLCTPFGKRLRDSGNPRARGAAPRPGSHSQTASSLSARSGSSERAPDPLAKRMLGAKRGDPDTPTSFLVLVFVPTAASLVTAALFFGYARLAVVLLPLWYSLIAVALVWIGSLPIAWVRIPGHRSRSVGEVAPNRASESSHPRITPTKVGVAVLGILLLLEAWGATGDRDYRATGTQSHGASHLNPHDTMHLEVIRD